MKQETKELILGWAAAVFFILFILWVQFSDTELAHIMREG